MRPAVTPRPSQPNQRSVRPWLAWLLLLALVLVLPCLGLAAGYGVAQLAGTGRLSAWHRLAAPPSPAVAILHGGIGLSNASWFVYIRGEDGQAYACPPYSEADDCWTAAADVPEPSAAPCDNPPNFDVPPPPGTVVDSLQALGCHPEAAYQVNFVVLEDGSVWRWQHFTSGLSTLADLLFFGLCGAGLGLAAAIAVGVVIWRKGRPPRDGQ